MSNIHQPDQAMYQFPVGSDAASFKAAEMQQHNYANYISAPDPLEAGSPRPLSEGGAVNQFESIPGAEQVAAYAGRDGLAIDPQAAEAVLADASRAVTEAYGTVPEPQVGHQFTPEYHRDAVGRAGVYAPRIEMLRERALEAGAQPSQVTRKSLGLAA